MKRLLVLLLCWQGVAQAASISPLTVDSLSQLRQRYQGERHALILWSLRCVPCRQELADLGRLPGHKQLAISLVNTDDLAVQSQIRGFLKQHGLYAMDNWQFAEPIAARLRQAIDSDWYGALPRSYAITAEDKRIAHAGRSDLQQLADWLQANH